MSACRCSRAWNETGEPHAKSCPAYEPRPNEHVLSSLERLLFRVALLRDLTVLSEKDRRALDAAYKNLDGVRRRAEGAS